MDEVELRERRTQAAWKRRRIIFNDDGGSARRRDLPLDDPRGFVRERTAPLVGTHVDAIHYCTTAGTFGRFYHRSSVAEVADDTRGRYSNSAIPGMIALGTDPLEVVCDFCRLHGVEVFWSLRMNDTHDAGNPLLVPKLKTEHPDWLFGRPDDRPVHGKWTSVDFGREEVRDLVVAYIEDVIARYRVDGIDLDFFRHPVFFATQGRGDLVTKSGTDTITGLIERIRGVLDRATIAQERAVPLLLSVLVPDSVEYCLEIGLDVITWLEAGYVDMLETTGYFRLNPWHYSVALGHRYGVPVYGCLAEPRLSDPDCKEQRLRREVYRARAMQIWEADADGICMFNYFDASSPLYREIGDPALLGRLSKIYYASVRGLGKPAGNPVPYQHHVNIPTLSPDHPVPFEPGERWETTITVGEDVASIVASGVTVTASLDLRLEWKTENDETGALLGPSTLPKPVWNDRPLPPGRLHDGWLCFSMSAAQISEGMIVQGENSFAMARQMIDGLTSITLLDVRLTLAYRK